jgi:hypothetical protein
VLDHPREYRPVRAVDLETKQMRLPVKIISPLNLAIHSHIVEFQNGTQDCHILVLRHVQIDFNQGVVIVKSQSGETRRYLDGAFSSVYVADLPLPMPGT